MLRRLVLPAKVTFCIFAALVLPSFAAAAATLKILKADQLRDAPIISAKVLADLKPGASVVYISRKGFWANVEIGGSRGWVRISALNIREDGKGSGLASIVSGRGATGKVVNTTGTRGLSAEEISMASPDLRELDALKRLSVSPEDAEAFATAGKLQSRSISYVRQNRTKPDEKGSK